MTRLFGTDGVRGVANSELTPELAFRLGEAAGHAGHQVDRAEAEAAGHRAVAGLRLFLDHDLAAQPPGLDVDGAFNRHQVGVPTGGNAAKHRVFQIQVKVFGGEGILSCEQRSCCTKMCTTGNRA